MRVAMMSLPELVHQLWFLVQLGSMFGEVLGISCRSYPQKHATLPSKAVPFLADDAI